MANKISGIGEYVHYHKDMYDQFGIARKNRPPKLIQIKAVHDYQTKAIEQNLQNKFRALSKEQIQTLENEINEFMQWLGGSADNLSSEEVARIQKTQQALAEKIFGEQWEKSFNNIAWTTEKIALPKGQQGLRKFNKGFEQYGNNWEQRVKQRIIRLNQKLLNLEKSINNLKEEKDVPKIHQLVKETEQWLLKDLKTIDDEIVAAGLKTPTPQGKYPNLRAYLNELITTYAPFITFNQQQGMLWELTVDAALNKHNELITANLQDISTLVKNLGTAGTNKDTVKYNPNVYPEGMFNKGNITQSNTNVYKFLNVINKITESQQKIDSEIIVEGEEKLIGASLKNVSLGSKGLAYSKTIHISTGNPLLSYLQDEDDAFVTHFLNIFSAHNYPSPENVSAKSNKEGSGRDPRESSSNAGIYMTQKRAYKQQLQLLILYKGLTGDVWGKTGPLAELFVVNNATYKANNSNKGIPQIKIYNMKDILLEALKVNLKNLDTILDISTTPKNLFDKNFHFDSTWIVGDWKSGGRSGTQRIAGILNQLYEMKVKAAIRNRLLMNTYASISKQK